MSFLNPLAFGLLALAVPIIALYFLKLRRQERQVSSTYLWRTLVRDTAANAPWQRLRPNLLLLLQLLFLLLLVLALVRPFVWSNAASGEHLIIVMDTSASMQATDVAPNRFAEAVRQARAMVDGLPAGARVTVITAGAGTGIAVAGATDRALAQQALANLRAGHGASDLTEALNLAAAVAARERDPETVIFSDGKVKLPTSPTQATGFILPGRARYVPVGQEGGANDGIGALSLRRTAGGQALSAFAQAVHFGPEPSQRRLTLYSGGQPVAARTLTLTEGQPQSLTFDDLPPDLGVVEARLDGSDTLPADDRAWTVAAGGERLQVDLVGPGNRFLETALALLPGLEVTTVRPEDFAARAISETTGTAAAAPAGLTIFDGVEPPADLPNGAVLFLAPLRSTALFSVTGVLEQPAAAAARADEPLLRYVDLRGLQVQEAARIPVPAWARPVVVAEGTECAGGSSCPLLFAGETGGRRAAVLAFDVRKSDLPLRVAFPLLLANLVDYLNAGSGAGPLPARVEPGQAVPLLIPPEAAQVMVRLPDGSSERLTPESGRAVFGNTAAPGAYEVTWEGKNGAAGRLGTFAVNLFSAAESDIAPANTLDVQGSGEGETGTARRQGRQEWWRILAWLALALLAVEWLYAHRGDLRRLLDGLRRHPRRAA